MSADNNSFLELDVSSLKPARYKVTLVEESTLSTGTTGGYDSGHQLPHFVFSGG